MLKETSEIILQYPYSQDWKHGYIVTNPENRKTLILYNSPQERSSTQYARYLLAVKLQRYLTKEETVDHIDNDKSNDSIENLQLLSRVDNIRKQCKKPDVTCTCPICGKKYFIASSKISGKIARERALTGQRCCSRSCAKIKISNTLKTKYASVA